MNKRNMLRAAGAALAASGLLAACGGGGSNNEFDPAAPLQAATIPDSALVSGTAYAEYAKTLLAAETVLAVDISKVNIPPTSETGDPIGL